MNRTPRDHRTMLVLLRAATIILVLAGFVAVIWSAVRSVREPERVMSWLAPLSVGVTSLLLGLGFASTSAPTTRETEQSPHPERASSARVEKQSGDGSDRPQVKRRVLNTTVSLIALLLSAGLGYWAIHISYGLSSDSQESVDLIGRGILSLQKAPIPGWTAGYDPGPAGRRIHDLADSAQRLMKNVDTAQARTVLDVAESLAPMANDAVARAHLGLVMANLGDTTGDMSFQRRALAHYDRALKDKQALGIERTLWVKSLRWWARVKLREIGIPNHVKAVGILIALAAVACLGALANLLRLDLRALIRQKRSIRRKGDKR